MIISPRKKIAIIGTGISGLGAASLLYPYHDITVYEKNNYIGGHSRTFEVETLNGIIPVDTGFIVFNKHNYPLLTRLFEYLKVPIIESNMSFGASIDNGWLEYSTQSLDSFFAQKKNFFRPAFWGMIIDILKFNAKAKIYLSKDPHFTLGDCLNDLKMGNWFQQYFLLAMGGAIWSSPLQEILKFPACTFIRFFDNHGLLTTHNQPQWYTVEGGSQEYVSRLSTPFKDSIHLNRGVRKVRRKEGKVTVEDVHGHTQSYDEVVFACHADQTLSMIADPSPIETKILSAFDYQVNRIVLHGDTSFMPRCPKAWASWTYLSENRKDKNLKVSLSYWMNNLQSLHTDQTLIITLNPGREPDPSLIYNDYIFEHPVFNAAAINNQNRIEEIQGRKCFWFCGAYQRYGFHEDGLNSAVSLAQRMGITPPW